MEPWVGYAHLFVTTALVCTVAFYGRKYGKTFEAAKQAEVEAKNAWIAKLEGELKLLREMSSENVRKHTIAMKEQLDDRISFLENKIKETKNQLSHVFESDINKTQIIYDLESNLQVLCTEQQLTEFFSRHNEQYYQSVIAEYVHHQQKNNILG